MDKLLVKKLYNIYNHIRYRCTNKNCDSYERYGGRGIKMRLGTFDEFTSKMYNSFEEHCKTFGVNNTTIDRINNEGDYSYDNIKWSTRKEQAQNRCTTKVYKVTSKIDGSTHYINNIMDFCNRVGIAYTTFISIVGADKSDEFIISEVDNTEGIEFIKRPIPIYVYEVTKG